MADLSAVEGAGTRHRWGNREPGFWFEGLSQYEINEVTAAQLKERGGLEEDMFWLLPEEEAEFDPEDEALWSRASFEASDFVTHPELGKYCSLWLTATSGLVSVVPPEEVSRGSHRPPLYSAEELDSPGVEVIQTASVRAIESRVEEGLYKDPLFNFGQLALCVVRKPADPSSGLDLPPCRAWEVRYFRFEDDETDLYEIRPTIEDFLVMNIHEQNRLTWHVPKAEPGCEPGALRDRWDMTLVDSAWQASDTIKNKYSLNPCWDEAQAIAGSEKTDPERLSVALCITTKNRLWQLRRALPLNLLHNWRHMNWCKIYLVDFASTDGTFSWVTSNCRAAIECGFLKFFYTENLDSWHASTGKNTAHRVAQEDILVNVDGDNLVGPDYALHVRSQFQDSPILQCFQYEVKDGTCGRIAIRKLLFDELKGYDQDVGPMGGQDIDLIWRVQRYCGDDAWSNISKKDPKRNLHGQAIPNSIEAKVEHCQQPKNGGKIDWKQMDKENKKIFKTRLARQQFVRNEALKQIGVEVKQVLFSSSGALLVKNVA